MWLTFFVDVQITYGAEVMFMKKKIIIALSVVVAFAISVLILLHVSGIGFRKLTLYKVVELSAKGDELTWKDFEKYKTVETGSGLYIWICDIDETFELWIGGSPTDEIPYYITLQTKSDLGNSIDIRSEDVEEFIELNKK